MNDLTQNYPLIPYSLIPSPLDSKTEDFDTARRIINLIAVKNKELHGLTKHNMAVIPYGVLYHSVKLGVHENATLGELQVTEMHQDSYAVFTYTKIGDVFKPEIMMMGVGSMEINDIIDGILEKR